MGVLCSRSNFVSKTKRKKKLTAKNFRVRLTSSEEVISWRKDPICYTNNNWRLKQQAYAWYTLCSHVFCQIFVYSACLLFSLNLFLSSPNKQTFALLFYCSTLVLSYSPIVLTSPCSTFLLFYPSIVSLLCYFTHLLFYPSIVLTPYCLLA